MYVCLADVCVRMACFLVECLPVAGCVCWYGCCSVMTNDDGRTEDAMLSVVAPCEHY